MKPGGDRARWAGFGLAAAVAVLSLAVQWGVVVAQLGQVQKRLDELIVEARSMRVEYAALERRVSFLEGQMKRP